MTEKILILDFGSQYTQLIARRVRELNVYSEIHPFNHIPEIDETVKGIILSGSPFSVRDNASPRVNLDQLMTAAPVLGVCYGAQLISHERGGEVQPSNHREYGRAHLDIKQQDELLKGLDDGTTVWMSHADTITKVPENATLIAATKSIPVAA
ncbi:MAG TPA: GMP synthase (glutamine-hydrolyzing), partial [Bacteroidia bacterium]|nr:GMP synthase (glutamine-hydrolyzing) [Bacteroidia bacterium]